MQIDGPAMAWFILDGKEVPYITYAIASNNNPGSLMQHASDHIRRLEMTGTVVWRRKPEISFTEEFHDPEGEWGGSYPAHWKLTYRLAVIPFLQENNVMCVKQEGERPLFID